MTGVVLGCIADDFTGATDLANNLVRSGMRALQTIGVPEGPLAAPVDAVVVALKSRTIPAADAVAQSLAALHWLQAQGARQIYFKYCSTFDSTPAGNIGPVAEALMQALGCDFTIATPAFPDNGRTEPALHRLHGRGIGGGMDQQRAVGQARLGPGERRVDCVIARGQAQRVERQRRPAAGDERRHLALRGQGAASRDHRAQATRRRQPRRAVVGGEAHVLRQSDGDAGAAGHQRRIFQRRAQAHEVFVRHRVDDREAHSLRAQRGDSLAHCFRTGRHDAMVDQPDRA